jgi:hypothetical protein
MSTENKYYQYNPEKRNIFFEIHSGRTNIFKELFIGLILFISSYGASIVEVFLRRKFGERYITFAQSITIFIFLPTIVYQFNQFFYGLFILFGATRYRSTSELNTQILYLYLFLLIYLIASIIHRLEIKRYGTTYDFKRFSLSDGQVHPLIAKLIGKKFLGVKITMYTVVTLLEPLVPIIVGIFLATIAPLKMVGIVLIISGLLFGLRNFHKAQQGRNWILDNIDKKILSEMQYDIFIKQKPQNETKGVCLPVELPDDKEIREALYHAVTDANAIQGDIWENDQLDKNEEDKSDNV